MNSKTLKITYERKVGQKEQLERALLSRTRKIAELGIALLEIEEARNIIQLVAKKTQKKLEYHLAEIVSLALASVFSDPYIFEIEFMERRNKTEADLYFVRHGKRITPKTSSEGGAIEIAAFALRIALWSLYRPNTRPVLIIDEPLKWLKGLDYPEKGAAMIKELSDKIGVQIIMVSHITDQIASADNVIEVKRKGEISYVRKSQVHMLVL